MQRDMDLVRQIILAVRDAHSHIAKLDGVDADTFCEHALLLQEAGLIEASINVIQHKPKTAIIWRLTWAGHDFAQSIVDDTLWNKAKDNVIKPMASWTFAILVDYLRGEITRYIPLGKP
jgi:hypothetical protein